MPLRGLFSRGSLPVVGTGTDSSFTANVQFFLEAALSISTEAICCVSSDRRIAVWNQKAEEITGYLSHEAKGRFCFDHMMGHYDENGSMTCLGECPITETLKSGQVTTKRSFARHKDGHLIAIRLRTIPVRNATAEVIGVVEAFQLDDDQSVGEAMDEIRRTPGSTDQEIPAAISQTLTKIRSHGSPAGLVLLRLDNRQALVNRYTQRAGDQLLGLLEKTLDSSLGRGDAVARIDADHFLVAVAVEDQSELDGVAVRLKNLAQGTSLQWWGSGIQFSVSVAATLVNDLSTVQDALRSAGQQLSGTTEA